MAPLEKAGGAPTYFLMLSTSISSRDFFALFFGNCHQPLLLVMTMHMLHILHSKLGFGTTITL